MLRTEFEGAGVSLVGDVVGDPAAPTVLFLHGGGQTRQSWSRALREAERRGYRAVSLDLRGHGESGWAPDRNYGFDGFVGDIRNAIAQLGGSPMLVGASLGGMIGMLLAAETPAPMGGLVLVDVAARIEDEGGREIGAFMRSAPEGFASVDEAADAVAAYLPHRPRPKDTSGLLRNLRDSGDGRYRWHWDPAFIDMPEDARPNPAMFEEAARRIEVPTLLIRGGRSRVVSLEGVHEFLALAPHAEFVDVADADHMVAGDANDAFNSAVFEFLERHAPVPVR